VSKKVKAHTLKKEEEKSNQSKFILNLNEFKWEFLFLLNPFMLDRI